MFPRGGFSVPLLAYGDCRPQQQAGDAATCSIYNNSPLLLLLLLLHARWHAGGVHAASMMSYSAVARASTRAPSAAAVVFCPCLGAGDPRPRGFRLLRVAGLAVTFAPPQARDAEPPAMHMCMHGCVQACSCTIYGTCTNFAHFRPEKRSFPKSRRFLPRYYIYIAMHYTTQDLGGGRVLTSLVVYAVLQG